MNLKSLLLSLLLLMISINLVSCKDNEKELILNPKGETTNNQNNKDESDITNSDTDSEMTEYEYKDVLIANYEKYIKPIEINEYEGIKANLLDNNEVQMTNQDIIKEFELAIDYNKNNISSFRESLKNLQIEDDKIDELNKELVKEAENLLYDMKNQQLKLSEVTEKEYKKSKEEFINYITQKINQDIEYKNQFKETLNQLQGVLRVNLEKT